MGAIAEAMVAFAQPLIDQTDGSLEEVRKAFALSQLCYNLALSPEEIRKEVLAEMRQSVEMDDREFDEFQRSVIFPMIQRHHKMFPMLHQRVSHARSQSDPSPPARSEKAARGERYPDTGPYEPCPCNSGEKFKFCCRAKGR